MRSFVVFMVVWRAKGPDFDVDAFLAKYAIPCDKPWRQGEERFRRVATNSGLSGCLYNGDSHEEGVESMRRFVVDWRPALDALASQNVQVIIDLGMSVGEEPFDFCRSVGLAPSDLRLLGEANVAFEVSAYASSWKVPDEPA